VTSSDRPALRFDVLTLFPEVFETILRCSMMGIAEQKGAAGYNLHDIRDWSEDKHNKVDDRPYGGGPGMVIRCEPVFACYEAVREMADDPGRLLLLTPQGRPFDHEMAEDLARSRRIILLCGHYEGFDERIREGLPAEEVSIGDYVLSGGEPAAIVIMDAVVRLLPGVLGDDGSALDESFAYGLLEYPHYTRPPEFRGMKVPEVLTSGHHRAIEEWRREQAHKRTLSRRADLLGFDNDSTGTETEDG
jgi:tRNA (guanine37-N1)-methyltransferase